MVANLAYRIHHCVTEIALDEILQVFGPQIRHNIRRSLRSLFVVLQENC